MYKLAKEAELSWSTVRNIFKRNTNPTISILEIMCKTLDISLSQFFDVDGQGGLTRDKRCGPRSTSGSALRSWR